MKLPHHPTFRARLSAIARVVSLLLPLAVIALWLGLDALHARANELLRDAGAPLLALTGARRLDGTHTLQLNGLSLRMRVSTTPDQPERVLATIAGRCRAHSGQLDVQLRASTRGKLPPRIAAGLLDPVVRLGNAQGGFVACLDLGARRLPAAELLARARRFALEADVAELGALRFGWVQRERDATRYVAIWSDTALPLRRAFPPAGDAPGSDVPNAPRPAASRRLLSAWQEGAAPLLVAYQSQRSERAALSAYESLLQAHGYRVRSGPPERSDRSLWLLASRDDESMAVIASPQAAGSLLMLTPLR